jgi:alpha-glucosidase
VLDEYGDRMMVAEAWVHADRRPLYLRPGEYHQAFDFDLLSAPWDASTFRAIIASSVASARDVDSDPTWVLSNHDVVRHPTRYGLPNDVDPARWLLDGPVGLLDEALGARRARAAALVTLALPGSTYVYQGDELGLPEAWDLPLDVLQDPIWHDSGHTMKGRDGCRVPLPWEPTGPSLGFGAGSAWLPQPAAYAAHAASPQDGVAGAALELDRSALGLRRRRLVGETAFELLDAGDDVLAFRRGDGFTCLANMGPAPVPLPEGEVLIASGPLDDGSVPGDTTVWIG